MDRGESRTFGRLSRAVGAEVEVEDDRSAQVVDADAWVAYVTDGFERKPGWRSTVTRHISGVVGTGLRA